MTTAPGADLPTRPVTGHRGIDAALEAVELPDDVHQHPEQLGRALEALQRALNPTSPPQGLPGPRP